MYFATLTGHLDVHAEVVIQGGELITLLWTWLSYGEIVRRDEDATTSPAVVIQVSYIFIHVHFVVGFFLVTCEVVVLCFLLCF